MTREQAKQWWPLVKAFGEGAEIQVAVGAGYCPLSNPNDCHFHSAGDYRLKPEPKLRAWKSGAEVSQNSMMLRNRHGEESSWSWQVVAVQNDGLVIVDKRGTQTLSWFQLLDNYERSLDHGKTWTRCGITEEI